MRPGGGEGGVGGAGPCSLKGDRRRSTLCAGRVQLKVSAEALKTDTLCGNEVARVPEAGQVDTVVRPLLVEVSSAAHGSRPAASAANVGSLSASRPKGRRRWSATTPCCAPRVSPAPPFPGTPWCRRLPSGTIFSLLSRGAQGEEGVPAPARVLRRRVGPGLRLRARSAPVPVATLPERRSATDLRFSAGDLMGRAMKNLDRLLAMPYGCGEQNMVLFAPNIFILNYLKNTGQLTPEIQEKATRFLESGESRTPPPPPPHAPLRF